MWRVFAESCATRAMASTTYVRPPPPRHSATSLHTALRGPDVSAACNAVFTNRLEDLRLQDLAEVDVRELVSQVQEFFGDFTVLDPHHFAVPIPRTHVVMQPFSWEFGQRRARKRRICSCSSAVIMG